MRTRAVRIADVIDRTWRAGWWFVLEAIVIGLLAWATYQQYGPVWGIGVIVAGVSATVAAALERARARVHTKTKDNSHA